MSNSSEQSRSYWNTDQLAEASGLDVSYIRRLLRDGDIKGSKVSRDWIIPNNEALRWLDERKKSQSKD